VLCRWRRERALHAPSHAKPASKNGPVLNGARLGTLQPQPPVSVEFGVEVGAATGEVAALEPAVPGMPAAGAPAPTIPPPLLPLAPPIVPPAPLVVDAPAAPAMPGAPAPPPAPVPPIPPATISPSSGHAITASMVAPVEK
jgi:hypothetical protein